MMSKCHRLPVQMGREINGRVIGESTVTPNYGDAYTIRGAWPPNAAA